MRLPVHRIIPFSNVEGIGNRTSIFVQGCNANCLYCHNSETIPMQYAHVTMYTIEALIDVIKSNMPFIRGITVSGGEATIYHSFLTTLFERVHDLGLTCYIDTNGFFEMSKLQDLIQVTDKILFDVKAIGPSLDDLCFSTLLMDNQTIDISYSKRFSVASEHMDNLKGLLALDKIEEVRLVYIKGFYDPQMVVKQIADLLSPYPKVLFKLIRVHHKGIPPERLNAFKSAIPSKKDMAQLEQYVYDQGLTNMVTIL